MSAPGQPRPDVAAAQHALDAGVRNVLGCAQFQRFQESTGLGGRWEDMEQVGRDDWTRPVEHLVPAEWATGERARWAVGQPDTTDGHAATGICHAAIGMHQCTPAPHDDRVHAAGQDGVLVGVWEFA